MCLNPVLIPNLNKGCHSRDPTLSFIKDTKSDYIPVGCGHCPSCLALKQSYFIQRFQMETLDNDLWTGMLSYNREHLPTVMINGYNHKYADTRDIQLLIKRLRNDNIFEDGFRYWFISERGDKTHRPHWHFIISTPKIKGETLAHKISREQFYWKAILDRWYTNKGSRRNPIKSPNLTYTCKNGRYNYDFHYVNPSLTKNGESDVGFYCTKYYLKGDDYTKRLRSALRLNIKEDDTFKYYWSLVKPKSLSSHYMGDPRSDTVAEYIRMCINFSIRVHSPFPMFLNPETSQTFPLCPYYRKLFLTINDEYHFTLNNQNKLDGVTLQPDFDMDKFMRSHSKFKKVLKRISLRDIDYESLISNCYEQFDNITENFGMAESQTDLGQNLGNIDFDYNEFDSLF